MTSVDDLARLIEPAEAVLFLGSGACLSSGAPTGRGLAEALSKALSPADPVTGELEEVAGILELRVGRPKLIEALRNLLGDLRPAGGILAIPAFPWSAIYTTNYDYLVERSYASASKQLAVSSSNFDYVKVERQPDATPYFKIHGTLDYDIADGHQARIVLTDSDYDDYSTYREVVFKRLDLDLNSKDLIVVGHSLRDANIRQYMDATAKLHREKSAPGRLFALMWERDEERAALMSRKGFTVAFGGIEDLLHAFSVHHSDATAFQASGTPAGHLPLAAALSSKTIIVSQAKSLPPNVSRLFNGSPATYGDIEAGFTFVRDFESSIVDAFAQREALSVVLTGVAGVGKTTLARRALSTLSSAGYACWEHNNNFPFLRSEWQAVESDLRAQGQYGVLYVDDCAPILSQLNQLLGIFAGQTGCALLLLASVTSAQWKPRTKSPAFFTRGEIFELSKVSDSDIHELINLADRKEEVRRLVAPVFANSSSAEKFTLLRRRCASDMYVCLKNIFATESLDSILLREYAELSLESQDMYRLVAAIEATGAQVHRQLVLRLTGIDGGTVSSLLELMQGIVDEFDIRPQDGIFGLSTRHRAIAQTISRYKYADEQERFGLLKAIVAELNPTLYLELRLVREICDNEFGIGSLASDDAQIELYRALIRLTPAERIPRHRIIGKYLRMGELDLMEHELNDALDSVSLDPPLARYGVLLLLRRATTTAGIMAEDRLALMLRAHTKASESIRTFPRDPYLRTVRGDVALAIAELNDDTARLDDAIDDIENAYGELREPNLEPALRKLRDARRTFVPTA